MQQEIKQAAQQRMSKTIESLKADLAKLRTGRAHPSLLEHIQVSYYGNDSPLSQVATVSVQDARTLAITPWEKSMVEPIEKAILNSDLGLNPTTAGQTIRVPLPPLTEERRKEMTKLVRAEGENAKVAIRNIRRDANADVKDLLKEKSITEDEERRAQDDIQKITDKFIAQVDDALSAKEKELMEV
jgi:ribosome recycling factor